MYLSEIENLINEYLFDYVSTKHRSHASDCGCNSMVEEMNEIRSMYTSGKYSIDEILTRCVCDRNGHQYCTPNTAIDEAVAKLKESTFVQSDLKVVHLLCGDKIIANFKDFEELYDLIRSVIGFINGIGPLTVYDTARRIGHLLDSPIYPKMYVYLSAGAEEGAKILLNTTHVDFRESIDLFRPFFGTLGSIFVEDMLCVFKNRFTRTQTQIMNNSRLTNLIGII